MATTQSLTLTQVSQSAQNNTSKVRILWTTTQTGPSYNNYSKEVYYWVSVNGGAETKYSVISSLPYQTTKTVVDTTIDVEHDGNGDCTVKVRTSFVTGISAGTIEKSATLKLDNIPRSSVITSASDVTLGNPVNVKWTPASPEFYYKLGFQIGDWKHSTEVVHPGNTKEYAYTGLTPPLEVANQIPNDPSGTMHVYLHTFTDSAGKNQIGTTSSATFKVTVPWNDQTEPRVGMTLTAEHSLPGEFNGLFIQGKSKVRGEVTAEGQFDTGIRSRSMVVGVKPYGEEEQYTSDYLNTPGQIDITGIATDNRGFQGRVVQQINVFAYRDPKLENVSAVRCDADGNDDESGNYLKIAAKITYAPIIYNNERLNIGHIYYRYKVEGSYSYSGWEPILHGEGYGSDEVITGPLLDGEFLATKTYRVEVMASDYIGTTASTSIVVPTDAVYWHRDGMRNALGLGKYNEKDNAVDSAWDFHMNGHKVTGLPTPTDDTDAVPYSLLRGLPQEYVVEQGTSEGWTYCKWNSGRVELWGTGRATYENSRVLGAELTYPFALTRTRCGIGTLNSYGGNGMEALSWNLKLAYGTESCKIWIHSAGSQFLESEQLDASVYIVGEWK